MEPKATIVPAAEGAGDNQPGRTLSPVDLETLLESSDDAIFSKTLENVVALWSRGAERVYGYTRTEMLGQPVTRLFPSDRFNEAADILERIKNSERIERRETVRLTKDGRRLTVLLTVSPLRDARGTITGALTVARDITKRRQAEETVQRLEAQGQNRALVLETANRVALDILAQRTGVEALRHIADAARTLAGARYAALGVARPGGTGLVEFVTVGLTEAEEAAIGPRPKGAGVLGLLLERSEPLRINVLSEHPASIGLPPNHPLMESFLGVPIRRGETVLGSLYLTGRQDNTPFSEADEVAVQTLGAHAAVAISHMHMLSQQRALVSGLIHAQEEERRAVAYDLHDGLTQYVMASQAHLETFRRAHGAGETEKAERELDQGLRYLREAVVESRRLVNGLRSLALDDLGLAGALEQLLAEEKRRAGWDEADLIHNVGGRRFDKTLETAVYRVAQEALTNARKHAGAARVHLRLLMRPEEWTGLPQLTLEVRDWGKGFTPQPPEGYGHVGLQSMTERVHLMDGRYQLSSAPGEGTTVHAVFPVPASQPEAQE